MDKKKRNELFFKYESLIPQLCKKFNNIILYYKIPYEDFYNEIQLIFLEWIDKQDYNRLITLDNTYGFIRLSVVNRIINYITRKLNKDIYLYSADYGLINNFLENLPDKTICKMDKNFENSKRSDKLKSIILDFKATYDKEELIFYWYYIRDLTLKEINNKFTDNYTYYDLRKSVLCFKNYISKSSLTKDEKLELLRIYAYEI